MFGSVAPILNIEKDKMAGAFDKVFDTQYNVMIPSSAPHAV